jgi:hypothetical protein
MTNGIRAACLAACLSTGCGGTTSHAHTGMSAGAAPPPATVMTPEVQADLDRVRAATAAYKDIAAAHKAGFPSSTPRCLSHPTLGGMGYHYIDRKVVDDKLELERPEILLYARDGNGQDRLTGVEYIIPLSQWTRSEPPIFFGQTLKRSEELKLWYLHVWAWEDNPSGLFADYNPKVKCS